MISLIEARRPQKDAEGFEKFADQGVGRRGARRDALRCHALRRTQHAPNDFVSAHYGRGRDLRCG
jgi:hypothetical protein